MLKSKTISTLLLTGFFALSLLCTVVRAQSISYPIDIEQYKMIQYDSNHLKFPAGDSHFNHFYNKLDRLLTTGEGQINIVHIGGSHVQADVFTGQCRKRFQSFDAGQNAGRGYVFPYRMAHTNGPNSYYFRYSDNWTTCRNVDQNPLCVTGIGGIAARSTDSISSMTIIIKPNEDYDYRFNRVKIMHNTQNDCYKLSLDSAIIKSIITHTDSGYTQILLNRFVDSLNFKFVKTDSIQRYIEFYGMLIESDDPGIIYHNLGINGASTSSFLSSARLELELPSLKPDLMIFGLGINDAHSREFNNIAFENRYQELCNRVLKANPEAAIIFITNNDSYLSKRNVNRNGARVQESMYLLATKNKMAVWDLYEVMGGVNSVLKWQIENLAQNDKIHFTHKGYILLGDLLFDAIIHDFGQYLEEQATP
jgi:lysophospholipase L1-like esterase